MDWFSIGRATNHANQRDEGICDTDKGVRATSMGKHIIALIQAKYLVGLSPVDRKVKT